MKYQHNLAIAGVIALGVGAFIFVRNQLRTNPADISGVTKTTKSGPSGALTTTPVNLGNVAFVEIPDALKNAAKRVSDTVRSMSIAARTDVRQSFGTSESARAAFTTNRDQLAGNYAPKAQATF